jgi:hypothetical protein
MSSPVPDSITAVSAFTTVPNLFPGEPPAMHAIEFVRRGLVPVGRDRWNRIVENEIPHVRVGNRRVVSTLAVSAWLLQAHETPAVDGEGSALHLIGPEETAHG